MSKTETPQQRHRIAKVSLAAMIAAGTAAAPVITAFAAESDQASEPEKNVVKQTVKEQAKAALDEAVKGEQAAKVAMDAAKAEMDQAQANADALRAAAAESQAIMDTAETKSDETLVSAAEESAEQARAAAEEEAAKQKAYEDAKADHEEKSKAAKKAEQAVKDAEAEQQKAQQAFEAAGGGEELQKAMDAKGDADAKLNAANKALEQAKTELATAEKALSDAQGASDASAAALEAAKSGLAAAEQAVPAAEAELAKAQKDLADAEAGKETEQIKAQKAVVAQKDQQDKQSAADAANKAYGDAVSKRDGAKGDLEKAQQAKSDADAKFAAAKTAKEAADADLKASNEALKTAKEAYESTLAWQEQAKKNGSLGFFESMGSDLAASFLKNPEKMSGVADTYTNLGASHDATDLGNMKKALETMSKINQIRKDVGMQELEVTDSIMAIGQIQANYAANKGNHMGLAPGYNLNTVMAVGENLAWNYLDPYLGWYDQEKAVFDKAVKALYGKTGLVGQAANDFYGQNHEKIDEWVANYQSSTDPYAQIGHYLAIINPVNTVYGCGYNGMNITNEQAFSGDWYASKTGEMLYSSDSYYKRFMQYYDKVYAAPDRSALTAAENDQAAKKQAADRANGSYSAAATAQADAESAQTAAAKAYQGSIDAANEAQAKRDAAQSALNLANGALADAQAADKAKLKARAAQQRADNLAQFNVLQNRKDAFFNGIQDEWVIENEPALVDAVNEQRRIYAEAKARLGAFAKDLETALPDLSAKKAKHADATAAYNKASLATLEAQQEYDGILAAEKKAAEDAAQAEKLANAKHAKRDEVALNNDARLVQTGDGSLLVMVGGAAVASVGVGLLANRKRKASSRD